MHIAQIVDKLTSHEDHPEPSAYETAGANLLNLSVGDRRRIKTEEKAMVHSAAWGAEFLCPR